MDGGSLGEDFNNHQPLPQLRGRQEKTMEPESQMTNFVVQQVTLQYSYDQSIIVSRSIVILPRSLEKVTKYVGPRSSGALQNQLRTITSTKN